MRLFIARTHQSGSQNAGISLGNGSLRTQRKALPGFVTEEAKFVRENKNKSRAPTVVRGMPDKTT